jgi:hypothetical protein
MQLMAHIHERWRRASVRIVTPEAFLVLCAANTFYLIHAAPPDLELTEGEAGYDDATGARIVISFAQTTSDP